MGKIDDFRLEIDKIDDQVLELLSRRGKIAQQIGNEKAKANLPSFHDPSREIDIFRRLSEANGGPYPDPAIQAIFREIFSATLSLEKLLKVAFLGPKATFTHLAAQKKFGKSTQFLPQKSTADIFSEVEKKNVSYGIVPIESSVEGIVGHTLDLLVDSPLYINSEISIEIVIHLLASHGDLSRIKKVCSHPHAIAQCREWIVKNLPNAQITNSESTAAAAKIAQTDESIGALANEMAAEIYDLKKAAAGIQDIANGVTRFVVISREKASKSGADKTSMVFSLKDQAGALVQCLKIFSDKGINMTKIESRPIKKKTWEYRFFVDIDGHREDELLGEALEELEKRCTFFRVLGSYPKGI